MRFWPGVLLWQVFLVGTWVEANPVTHQRKVYQYLNTTFVSERPDSTKSDVVSTSPLSLSVYPSLSSTSSGIRYKYPNSSPPIFTSATNTSSTARNGSAPYPYPTAPRSSSFGFANTGFNWNSSVSRTVDAQGSAASSTPEPTYCEPRIPGEIPTSYLIVPNTTTYTYTATVTIYNNQSTYLNPAPTPRPEFTPPKYCSNLPNEITQLPDEEPPAVTEDPGVTKDPGVTGDTGFVGGNMTDFPALIGISLESPMPSLDRSSVTVITTSKNPVTIVTEEIIPQFPGGRRPGGQRKTVAPRPQITPNAPVPGPVAIPVAIPVAPNAPVANPVTPNAPVPAPAANPIAPNVPAPVANPIAPNAPVANPVAPNAPVPAPAAIPVAPNAPAVNPVAPNAPVANPVAPNAPAVNPVAPNAPVANPVAPNAPAVNPMAPNAPVANPVAPNAPAVNPMAPNAPVANPVAPNVLNPPNAPVVNPMAPNAPVVNPVAPNAPVANPMAPNAPVANPMAPNAPVANPVAPNAPGANLVAPNVLNPPNAPVVNPMAPNAPVANPMAPNAPVANPMAPNAPIAIPVAPNALFPAPIAIPVAPNALLPTPIANPMAIPFPIPTPTPVIINEDGSATTSITQLVGPITVVVSPDRAVIGGQIVPIGSSTVTIREGDSVFTVSPNQVEGPLVKIFVPKKGDMVPETTPLTPTTVQGVPIQLGPTRVVIGSATLPMQPGATPTKVIVGTQTIIVGPGGIGFLPGNGFAGTIITPPPSIPTNVVVIGGEGFSAIGSTLVAIGDRTLTYGPGIPPQLVVYNGEVITVGPTAVVFDGTTIGGPSNKRTQYGNAGGLSISEIGPTLAVINGETLTVGYGAPLLTTVIGGQTFTVVPQGIAIGGHTLEFPFNPVTKAITAGGITFTQVGDSIAVIGSKTITFGPKATPTTVSYDGQLINIGPGGIGFTSTTILGPKPTKTGISRTTTSTPYKLGPSPTATSAGEESENNAGRTVPVFGLLGVCMILSLL
ncbi:hypothetical protein LZ554_003428 [Drepanopeziza brunnea f. sp. 'monogermtubi']|nr:hypothetical protein LZ554_003428 [Drepanopeziza brunnea f. sp. 'monogermtubi']